eukprot:7338470-Alexandrium_andersonii.AAC.1
MSYSGASPSTQPRLQHSAPSISPSPPAAPLPNPPLLASFPECWATLTTKPNVHDPECQIFWVGRV